MTPGNAERRKRLAGWERTATRVGVWLVVAGPVLGVAAALLGALEVYPYEYAAGVALTAMLVPVGLALLVGAVCGLYVMAGPRVAPFGVVFVAGFAALVYGIVQADVLWRDIGVGLLAISGTVFYLAGVVSERAPIPMLNTWGRGGAMIGGAVLAVVGHRYDQWALLLFGAMALGCGAGSVLGRWWLARRQPR